MSVPDPGLEMTPFAGLRSTGRAGSAAGVRRCGLLGTPALPSVLLLSCLFMASVGWVVGLFVVLGFSLRAGRAVCSAEAAERCGTASCVQEEAGGGGSGGEVTRSGRSERCLLLAPF